MSNNLPENVFPISDAPTQESGNQKGEILWYANGHGWYVSKWNFSYMPETSHWTYMPEDLGIPSEAEQVRHAAFERWKDSALAYGLNQDYYEGAQIGFFAGWKRGPA